MHDLRYALRVLSRAPAFSISAILALALGIGANTGVFSVVHAVLLEPLPYVDPDRLVRLYEANHAQGIERGDVSPATFVEWRSRSRTLEDLAVYRAGESLLAFGPEYEHLEGAVVSPSLFGVLGISPALGRTFRPEAQQSAPFGDRDEVIIGYDLWQRRFGGRATVLGETVRVEGRVVRRIVGVMPRGFAFPDGAEVWSQETFLRPVDPRQRETRYHQAIGRLRPAITIHEVRTELGGISAQLAQEHAASNAGFTARVERLDRAMTADVQPALLVLLGVVGCVLLIACANVANLMVARAAARRREFAVRTALGATVPRLLLQSFAESALLSAVGLAVGLLFAWWGTSALIAAAPPDIPRLNEAGLDGAVLIFTAAITVMVAVFTAIVPAMQIAAANVHDTLKRLGRSAPPRGAAARTWIIAGEVALTVVLLVAATVLLRSFVRLRSVDLGFDPSRVVTADLRFPTGRFADTRHPWFRLGQTYDRILEDIRSLPGVESAGGITGMPLTGEGSAGVFWLGDAQEPPPDASQRWTVGINIVTPGYFTAMRIPVIRGRGFAPDDRLTETVLTNPDAKLPRGVAIVNEAMARRYWPGKDPIGRSIKLADHWSVTSSTVIGVVGDVRADAVGMPPTPAVFVPWGEIPGFRLALAVRTRGDVSTLASALRSRLRALDSQLFVSNLRPLDTVISGAVARPRFNLLLVASFAVLALALAAVGIYGVVAYLVTERTREIGIRIAIGALGRDVLRLVVGDGLRPVVIGLVAGMILALAAVRAMRGLLFEIAPVDPVSFAVAPALLLAVAAAAALIPARRATRVDPLVALRDE